MSSIPFFRDDTIFGVCEALGEDFGLNPNLLRASIGAGLLFSPVTTVGVYFVAAFLVLASRWLVPDPPMTKVSAAAAAEAPADLEESESLPLAA